MGLFDGYFDPQQFADSGGLLGRLLSLQQMQGQYQLGADDLDQAPSAPQTPPRQPMPRPNLPGYGQPSSDGQPAAPKLTTQYQALRPVLGDHNAMLATVNPEIGKTLIAQALANQQSGNIGNVVSAGYGRGILFPPMVPVPLPPIPMPAIPDWLRAAGIITQMHRRILSGIGGGGGDDDNDCKEERREARRICTDAFANGWKSDYGVGPYRSSPGKRWSIEDCMRGFISERCGGNATDR